ncbi:MAG: DUF3795 domain-containing protein [Planctomycetota bacterium]|nr:DUF3795 domain-containing protein [Planctomycetota bacterium]
MTKIKIIGSCGLECSSCPAFKAYAADDDELRKKTADEWSKVYEHDFKPSDINCSGCRRDGVKVGYCSMCPIRKCNIERGYQNCAFCSDFPCDKLTQLYQVAPAAKLNIERLRP